MNFGLRGMTMILLRGTVNRFAPEIPSSKDQAFWLSKRTSVIERFANLYYGLAHVTKVPTWNLISIELGYPLAKAAAVPTNNIFANE